MSGDREKKSLCPIARNEDIFSLVFIKEEQKNCALNGMAEKMLCPKCMQRRKEKESRENN